MSRQFTLLGWSASGLRCPDHEVNLCLPDNHLLPYPVTLVQMPNGTGKTTTLTMLRAALSGSAQEWNSEKIRELRRSGDSATFGKFVVKIAVNNKPLTFELKLNFDRGKVEYRTSYGTGISDGFFPPAPLRKFLNSEFVNLFVFDGELASNLLDSKQTRARSAIDSLFQLSLLEEVAKAFQENWEKHAESAKAKSNQGLNRRINTLKRLQEKQKKIKLEHEKSLRHKSTLNLEIQSAEKNYETAFSKDKNIGSQLQKIKVDLEYKEKIIAIEVAKAISKMRDPERLLPKFGEALKDLKANLDRLKLPTSTSKEFFEELAQAEECVCGRKMNEVTRSAVRDRAKNYLADDEVGVLNSIKSDIALHCSDEPEVPYQELQKQLADLGYQITKRDNLKTEMSAIEQTRFAQGDSELEEKKQYLEKLKEQLRICTERLKEIERSPHTKPSEDTDSLKELDKLIEKAEYEVAEATETLNLKSKTEIAKRILAEAHQQAREYLRKFILEETNQRIAQLLSRDPVFLEDIQDSLQLRGQSGASVGQTLSVSYAFLATLFNRSEHQLPFIVDSPAGSLDLKVRPEVARLIPSLCDQFVAFTISSERQSFVNVLDRAANQQVQYLTIFRKTSRMNALLQNVPRDRIKETVDGVIVNGNDFFERFDLDEEL
jgi:DNA sulfur modification protein DndD